MVRPIDRRHELASAWRALAGFADPAGWRTIRITGAGSCGLIAARHFPGGEEAMAVGFSKNIFDAMPALPEGRGFVVTLLPPSCEDVGRAWIALSRKPTGSLELFTMMASDIIDVLDDPTGGREDVLLRVFLARIRAWQDFMQRRTDDVLGPEAELGLVGELVMLQELLAAGLPPSAAVEAWRGPLSGIHDFAIGDGGIEVKTSASPAGFPAVVGSLEQLDDSRISPLFVAAVRVSIDESGLTLGELIDGTREALTEHREAVRALNDRLLRAGWLDARSDRHVRRYTPRRTWLMPVTDEFPRLVRSNVPPGILRCRYEIDLDTVALPSMPIGRVLDLLE